MSNVYHVCFTGHRPSKLFGYNLQHPGYDKIRSLLRSKLVELCEREGKIVCISGMALGIDQLAVDVCSELQSSYNIEILLAIPCRNQDSKWPYQSQQKYKQYLAKFRSVLVSDCCYNAYVMQKRNEWMVDHSDMVICWWNGSSGGTRNCINYAKYQNIPVVNLA